MYERFVSSIHEQICAYMPLVNESCCEVVVLKIAKMDNFETLNI